MAETETAVFKVHIRGKIEDVWREITKTDELQKQAFNNRMHVDAFEVGGQIRMRSANGKWTGVVGEILEYDPPRRFAHTFRFTNVDDPPCIIRYELAESGDGVDFTLIADRIPVGTKTAKQIKQGGTFIVNTLKSMVETGKPTFGGRVLFALIAVMAPFNPKRCRTENWPLETKLGDRVGGEAGPGGA